MGIINVLNKQMSELIAAGEVVERPASVVKELIENSIDAGATQITVEIERGGILLIRVTDNGCGMERSDVKTAFLRHATSKLSVRDDLDAIGTLGFRGEALAAISAVSRVEVITRRSEDELGTVYTVIGGEEGELDDIGCASGTTITVRDIFYNTPARMKFLKKDVSEGNAVAAVVDRIAMSAPDISFKMIRDGKVTRSTPGDGKLSSAVYTVMGRDFSSSVDETEGEQRGIKVHGYVSKPTACRPNRNWQYTYINGRLVRSKTIMAALEQAYKNASMIGRFPACVLHISLPLSEVDVNVHPAKTEVRFSDEKRIFDAVYYTVKGTLSGDTRRPTMIFNDKANKKPSQAVIGQFFEGLSAKEFVSAAADSEKSAAAEVQSKPHFEAKKNPDIKTNSYKSDFSKPEAKSVRYVSQPADSVTFASGGKSLYSANGRFVNLDISVEDELAAATEKPKTVPDKSAYILPEHKNARPSADAPAQDEVKLPVKFIGEVFSTYIIAQQGEDMFLLDKHAAHERLIFEELKRSEKPQSQMLLSPVSVPLSPEEYDAVISNLDLLNSSGYEVEDFGGTVLVRAVPVYLDGEDPASLISEAAGGFLDYKLTADTAKLEWLYHSVSCRAAVKAGTKLSDAELEKLAERVLLNDDIMFCPHGRPVAIKLTKKDIEKQFGRLG